ncbi:MAG: hypothetical protein KY475_03780 [Planctomycetes bacterium]|nr:hypothetical protein [Planctomycetota bacterium]
MHLPDRPTACLLAAIAFAAVSLVRALQEVTMEDGVVVIHRDFGKEIPAISPNGRSLAVCGNEQLRFLDPATGRRFGKFHKLVEFPVNANLASGGGVIRSRPGRARR